MNPDRNLFLWFITIRLPKIPAKKLANKLMSATSPGLSAEFVLESDIDDNVPVI